MTWHATERTLCRSCEHLWALRDPAYALLQELVLPRDARRVERFDCRAARPCSCTGWPCSTGWRAMCTLPTGKWRPARRQRDLSSTLGDLPQVEDREELKDWAYERMLAALDEHADEEIRRGVTLVGPHRDEIEFAVAGRSARSFASQGQQRTLVLAGRWRRWPWLAMSWAPPHCCFWTT